MSERYTLTEEQITTLQGALEVARDRYRENARVFRKSSDGMPGMPGMRVANERLAEQFERQAAQCEALLAHFEA